MPPSYVVGSSYQLLELTESERKHLDTQPWVFACNCFLNNWETAGFRPTVWAWGDNDRLSAVDLLADELWALRSDALLQQRLTHRFVALEQFPDQAKRVVDASGVPGIEYYRRGKPWAEGQTLATSLHGKLYHYGSTLTNLVNLAWILNPGQPVYLLGCSHGTRRGHFYDPDAPEPTGRDLEFWKHVVHSMWLAFGEMAKQGVEIVDCNLRHETEPPGVELFGRGVVLGKA